MDHAAYTAILVVMTACAVELDIPVEPITTPVSVATYNLANQLGTPRGEVIAGHLADLAPEFVSVQEANDLPWLMARLPAVYATTDDARAGVALIYDASRFHVRDAGIVDLGDDDGWGPRVVVWGAFADASDRGVSVYATHFCVPIRAPDDACDESRQVDHVADILSSIDGRRPTVIAGDLNVFDGFEAGMVVGHLEAAGFVDAFRAAHPDDDGTTFIGNSWAPAGRIDYIFASAPVDVVAAAVERDAVAMGDGSDHFAVTTTLAF